MATAARRTTKKSVPQVPEDRTPSEVVAATILAGYSDLAPSVSRIMEAGLGEDGQLYAITRFQESLQVPGDPMRLPANAIEAGRQFAPQPG
jgi:hypothetical protein